MVRCGLRLICVLVMHKHTPLVSLALNLVVDLHDPNIQRGGYPKDDMQQPHSSFLSIKPSPFSCVLVWVKIRLSHVWTWPTCIKTWYHMHQVKWMLPYTFYYEEVGTQAFMNVGSNCKCLLNIVSLLSYIPTTVEQHSSDQFNSFPLARHHVLSHADAQDNHQAKFTETYSFNHTFPLSPVGICPDCELSATTLPYNRLSKYMTKFSKGSSNFNP